MGAFRFSCNFFGVSSGDAFVDKCRRAEEYGYDAVLAPDHLGAPAPFPLLVAAAAATERLRVGTLVLNVPFWNPALLAELERFFGWERQSRPRNACGSLGSARDSGRTRSSGICSFRWWSRPEIVAAPQRSWSHASVRT